MAAMTRWDPMDPTTAEARFRHGAERLALREQLGAPPAIPGLPCDVEHFARALDDLRTAPWASRKLALQCALEVALDTEALSLPQHLAMRTAVEALAMEPGFLEQIFKERTGGFLPPPWDPSRPEAWPHGDPHGTSGHRSGGGSPPSMSKQPHVDDPRIARIKALAMLGLDEEATEDEIRQAFRRVSKVHHPDHFQPLGEEATQAATQAFRRIKEAYDFLLRSPR